MSRAKTGQPNTTRSTKLLYALNAAAATLQRSAHSEEEIFQTFKEQIGNLNLTGSINLFEPDTGKIVVRAATLAESLQKTLKKTTELKIEGFTFNDKDVDVYNEVIKTQQALYLPNNKLLVSQVIPLVTQPFSKSVFDQIKEQPSIQTPIMLGEDVLGILNIIGDDLTTADIPAVSAFANHIAVALEIAHMFANLHHQIAQREHAEARLRKSEERYRILFEEAQDAIFLENEHDEIVDANRQACEILGYTREELLSKTIADLQAPEARGTPGAIVRNELHGRQKARFETVDIRRDGTRIPLEITMSRLTAANDNLILSVARDITAQKQVAAEREKRMGQLMLLNVIGRQIVSVLDLDRLFAKTVQLVQRKFGYHHVGIFIRDAEQHVMVMKARAGAYAALFPADHRLQFDEGMVGWVVRNNKTLVANNVRTEPHYHNPFPHHPQMVTRAELSVPIRVGGNVIGVLDIQNPTPNAFDKQSVVVMKTLAGQIAVAIENAHLYETVKQELTERKRAEAAIRQRNRDLALLNRIIEQSVSTLDETEILSTACRELALVFGVPQAAAVLFNPTRAEATIITEDVVDGQAKTTNTTLALENSQGFFHLLNRQTPLVVLDAPNDPQMASLHAQIEAFGLKTMLLAPLIAEGETMGVLGIGTNEPYAYSQKQINLTQRVAEQVSGVLARLRLIQTRERFSAIIEQSTEAVLITDPKGIIVYTNPAFSRMTGYPGAEVCGKPTIILGRTIKNPGPILSAIRDGRGWEGRMECTKKDGTPYTSDTIVLPIRDTQDNIINFVGVQRDVTHQLEIEAQLRQSQKMEAVGQLAAGIAHDFNNMLTAINGFAELLQFQLHPDSVEYDYALQILEAGQRAATLVGQLLAFSRKQMIAPKILNLNQTIVNMQKMLQRLAGEAIALKTILHSNLWPIKMDPAQIEQVMVNLTVNARDAMQNGGKLIIETANVTLDKTYTVRRPDVEQGQYVMLAITDTGAGISRNIQERVFEPFFTTKELGKGTGLGLATVFGIVKQNDGDIELNSTLNKGTTFKIYFPRARDPSVTQPEMATDPSMPTGDETILLVEDNHSVRELSRLTLQECGYQLLEAASGNEALEIAENTVRHIDLLLTDIVMPGISGKTVAEKLRQTHPHLKVLFMSGYADDPAGVQNMLDEHTGFIAKPFNAALLTQTVRVLLDEQSLPTPDATKGP